jgi:hypothetical protein
MPARYSWLRCCDIFGWVVSISPSSSLTLFSPRHRALMIFSRIGVDISENSSAAIS